MISRREPFIQYAGQAELTVDEHSLARHGSKFCQSQGGVLGKACGVKEVDSKQYLG